MAWLPSLLLSLLPAAQEPSPIQDALEQVRASVFASAETDSPFPWRMLALAEIGDLAAGAGRLPDGTGQLGARLDAQRLLDTRFPLQLYAHLATPPSGHEEELTANLHPLEGTDLILRSFQTLAGDGFSAAVNHRQQEDWAAKSNYGAGALLTSRQEAGAYGWLLREDAADLFAGAALLPDERRIVIGQPRKGDPVWRYFRMEGNGFLLDEFLFTTDGANLNPVDAYSALNNTKAADAVVAGKGVFTYQVPPIAGRGTRDQGTLTGGLIHTRTLGTGALYAELTYGVGGGVLGVAYQGVEGSYSQGTISLPFGWDIGEDDGLNRGILYIRPGINLAAGGGELFVALEKQF
ncbi:MAG: hypothetical protein HY520_02005 [Candidatus Aenigmarchaeota archaeon]|nr:hypothetical protein [Candidatus Aenigmarchaeota archaeon]